MKLRILAAAAALAVSGSAFAATPDITGTGKFGDFFGSATALFADTFTFQLASASNVSGSTGASGIGTYGLVLLQGANVIGTDATPASFSFSNLMAGSYTLEVVGFGAGAGSFYGGSLTTTPVPEPETYALMLAGLGMVGFMASRRSRG